MHWTRGNSRVAVWSHALSLLIAVSSFFSLFENPAILQQRPAELQGLAHMDKHSEHVVPRY
ncbi:uncharacterized protein BDW70DRAFT_144128 [Aspergillus foveolatus]|uniref:uncharacterized protein n=1 Tax=Aspergillus foveolatus TaxID=210207 RepID=UPI003CCCB1FA